MSQDETLTNKQMDEAVEWAEADTQAVVAANAQRRQAEETQRARQVLANIPAVKAITDGFKAKINDEILYWQKEALDASLAGDTVRCAQALRRQEAALETLSDMLP